MFDWYDERVLGTAYQGGMSSKLFSVLVYAGLVITFVYMTRLVSVCVRGVTVSLSALLSTLTGTKQTEMTSRLAFAYELEAQAQKDKQEQMQGRNEELIHNILPGMRHGKNTLSRNLLFGRTIILLFSYLNAEHVVHQYLGRLESRRDEDLYAESHDATGVMFCAIPNFWDFYTEEAVNKQGLECLRFLNEMISDFDNLLIRYPSITKIKNVGEKLMVGALSARRATRNVIIAARVSCTGCERSHCAPRQWRHGSAGQRNCVDRHCRRNDDDNIIDHGLQSPIDDTMASPR